MLEYNEVTHTYDYIESSYEYMTLNEIIDVMFEQLEDINA